MPKLNGKTYAYTKKGKEKYKKALIKSKKREDGDILYGSKNVRVQRIVHDSDDATQVYRNVRIKNPFKKIRIYMKEKQKNIQIKKVASLGKAHIQKLEKNQVG